MLTAIESFTKVRNSVNPKDDGYKLRFSAAASVGDVIRHGDLYLTKLACVPDGAVIEKKPSPQLTEGSTQGSRHILESLDGVKVYRVASATPLDGPVIELVKERVLTHPEHAHIVLEPGVYGVTAQRAYGKELKRVMD